jgi:serine phosphatase RsbU (regulator of sigma subunit)
MSMVGNGLLNQIINEKGILTPNVILESMNTMVTRALKQRETQNKDGMDMALCVYDYENKELQFSGAKNPLIYVTNGELITIKGTKRSIGGYLKEAPKERFENHTIPIKEETICYIFSDGYQDQFGGEEGRKFLVKNFRELLLKIHKSPMSEQKTTLNETIVNWMKPKHSQVDDILVIGFKLV